MDNAMIAQILDNTGHEMIELAEHIDDSGRPLTSRERDLISTAKVSLVEGFVTDIKIGLFINNERMVDDSLDQIHKMLQH
jgi:hypothetical protein